MACTLVYCALFENFCKHFLCNFSSSSFSRFSMLLCAILVYTMNNYHYCFYHYRFHSFHIQNEISCRWTVLRCYRCLGDNENKNQQQKKATQPQTQKLKWRHSCLVRFETKLKQQNRRKMSYFFVDTRTAGSGCTASMERTTKTTQQCKVTDLSTLCLQFRLTFVFLTVFGNRKVIYNNVRRDPVTIRSSHAICQFLLINTLFCWKSNNEATSRSIQTHRMLIHLVFYRFIIDFNDSSKRIFRKFNFKPRALCLRKKTHETIEL